MTDFRIDDVMLSVSEACDLGHVARARLEGALTRLVTQVDDLTEQRDILQVAYASLKEVIQALPASDSSAAIIAALEKKDQEIREFWKENTALEKEIMDHRIALSSIAHILTRSGLDD